MSNEKPELNIYTGLTKKQKFTDAEIRQASLYRDYLERAGDKGPLYTFVDKAIKNNMADNILERMDQEREEDYQERKRSLIYVE